MYYDISELEVTGKDMAIAVLICVVFLVVCFFAGYCIGWERAEDVYCNGSGTAGIEQQIGEAGADIQHAKDGITEAVGTADKIGSGIKDAKESAEYIQSTANTSAELISECQSIIERIRSRGETETK